MVKSRKQFITDLIVVILGNFILSAGVAFFIVPCEILSGGVAGIAVAIHPLIPMVSTTLMISILTIALFLAGIPLLGKDFAIKTLLSSLLYPFFVSSLEEVALTLTITTDPLLASLYGGILVGMGVGLVFRTGASTGGTDIPALILHKYTHIPLGTLVILVDGLTVLLGVAIHGIEPALIGLISVWAGGVMVDKTLMFGSSHKKSVMIISEKYEEMMIEISKNINRGMTLLEAQGGYTRKAKKVLMVVILQKQFPDLNRIIHSIDPGAFVIVQEVNEVMGEGFTFHPDKEE